MPPSNPAKGKQERARSALSSPQEPPAVASPVVQPPAWSFTGTIVAFVVAAFFTGLFAGQELLHRPQVVQGQAAPVAQRPPDSETAGGSPAAAALPADHSDASMEASIKTETDPQRLRVMGGVFLEEHKLDLAERALQKGLQLAPTDAAGHALLGFVYEEGGKNSKARDELARSLELKPPTGVRKTIQQELDRLRKS